MLEVETGNRGIALPPEALETRVPLLRAFTLAATSLLCPFKTPAELNPFNQRKCRDCGDVGLLSLVH